jgi:DNA-binding CsgD family transcriptional regulator
MMKKYNGLMRPDGTLLYTNEASLDLVGAKLDDVVGQPICKTPWHTDTPGAAEAVQGLVKRARDTKAHHALVLPLNLPTGFRLLNISMTPIMNAHGDVMSIRPEGADVTENPLSEREKEVLTWTEKGKTAWEIGAILEISRRTVEFHAKSIRDKLNANSVAHAVGIAIRAGIISLITIHSELVYLLVV